MKTLILVKNAAEGAKGATSKGPSVGGWADRRGPSDSRAVSRHREERSADTLPTWVTLATSGSVQEAGRVKITQHVVPVTRKVGTGLSTGAESKRVVAWGYGV